MKSKTPTNTNNVNKSVKSTNQTDRLQVNKRDVIMYTLRAIHLLFTPQELRTLQDTYGDNLLHRALKALNETGNDTKSNINKDNADDDTKKNYNISIMRSGENTTGLSFERIFSGKPKEVIPIKSKSDLRKQQQQQQQQQQKANARAAASRNRHTQMTSASLRLGEELSEEELELQRVREEEQKHMELFWVALTQPALISTPNLTNTEEQPFANYNVGALNKSSISTSAIATTNNNNNNNYSHVKKSTNKETSNSNSTHTPMQQKTNKKVEGKNATHMEDDVDKEIDYVSSMSKGTVGSYSLTTLVNFVKNLCFRSHYNELDLTDLLHALMTCHHYTQVIQQNNNITNVQEEEQMNEMESCYENETSIHPLHKELSASALNALPNRSKLNDEVHDVSLTHASKLTIGHVEKTKDTIITSKQSKKQEQNKFLENEIQHVGTAIMSSGSKTNKDGSQNENNKEAEQSSFSDAAANTSSRAHDVNGNADKNRQHKTKEKHHSSQNQVNINHHNNRQNSNTNANKRSTVADKTKSSHGQSEVQNEHTNTKNKQIVKSRDVDHTSMHSSRNKEYEYSESNSDNEEKENEEITASLTINNLVCGLCYYVPFVEQRLRFMREECDKCISALHRTNASDSHKIKENTSSSKKNKSDSTCNSDDYNNVNCELSN